MKVLAATTASSGKEPGQNALGSVLVGSNFGSTKVAASITASDFCWETNILPMRCGSRSSMSSKRLRGMRRSIASAMVVARRMITVISAVSGTSRSVDISALICAALVTATLCSLRLSVARCRRRSLLSLGRATWVRRRHQPECRGRSSCLLGPRRGSPRRGCPRRSCGG